jgi:hypothetical protein
MVPCVRERFHVQRHARDNESGRFVDARADDTATLVSTEPQTVWIRAPRLLEMMV